MSEFRRILEAARLDSGVFAAPAPSVDVEVNEDRGTIEGYANTWTRDTYNSKFLAGAFDRTIRERHLRALEAGDRSDVNFRLHHRDPCGVAVVLAPDSKGLRAVAQLVDFKERGTAGYTALIMAKERVMKGLSIGFDYIWDKTEMLSDKEMRAEGLDPDDPMNWFMPPHDIYDCDLREFSLVSDPANAGSRVEVVRSISRVMAPGWRPLPQALERSIRKEEEEDTPPPTVTIHLHLPLPVREDGADTIDPNAVADRAVELLEQDLLKEPAAPPAEDTFDQLCARLAERM